MGNMVFRRLAAAAGLALLLTSTANAAEWTLEDYLGYERTATKDPHMNAAVMAYMTGLLDGIVWMQAEAESRTGRPLFFCLPRSRGLSPMELKAVIDTELKSRADHWATSPKVYIGGVAIVALKSLYPCQN
jgi:hypothetical protein